MGPGTLLYLVGLVVFFALAVLAAPRGMVAVPYLLAAFLVSATWPASLPIAAVWLSLRKEEDHDGMR